VTFRSGEEKPTALNLFSIRTWAVAVVVTASVIGGCVSRSDRVLVDEGAAITFLGRTYTGVSDQHFVIPREVLIRIGTATRSNVPGDGVVYRLPEVDEGIGVVIVTREGKAVLFLADSFLAALPPPRGDEPLAKALQALCRYWRSPPSECTRSSGLEVGRTGRDGRD
jgi:hypothetical protein